MRRDYDAVCENPESGAIDGPTGLKTIGHIFIGEKCDFYEITDGLSPFDDSPHGELVDDYNEGEL